MVLHVSADHKDATLVSFPRDTMMPIPECTAPDGQVIEAQDEAQINGALAYGPYCTMDAISAFTGLPIDHFVVVDFDGVIEMTNAIGGVDVCVEHDVEDTDSGLFLTAGEHNLQGADALAFVRTREGFADGSDLGRISAQQTFLAALARKVKSAGTLANPVALFNLADAASRSVSVDPALGAVPSMVGLAGTLANVDLNRMVFLQLPVEDYWADSNRVQPIYDQAEQIFAALRADQPLSFGEPAPEAAPEGEQPDAGTPAPTEPAPVPVPVPDEAKGQTAIEATCAK
jgi:LCP family protein required for cell wall assembly